MPATVKPGLREAHTVVVISVSSCLSRLFQDQMTFLEAVEDTSSYAGADEKSEDFYGGGGQFRKGGKEHFPQLWCRNGTYSSYGQASVAC